ncbi:MAG: DUF166 family protein [Archaeoglobaceae archaeon]|nr:DUF166 family protein [Archaeoglobaceae archaeon]
MKIGVVVRKGQRRREIELFSKIFDVECYELPRNLPEVIENPSEFLNLPPKVPEIVISFSNHPDINLELIKQVSLRGGKIVVISGGAKSGSYRQLKSEGERLGVKVIWEEVCCTTPKVGEYEFFKHFGAPEFEVEIEKDFIRDVRVVRSAFCGASYFVAEKLKGLRIDEAPTKAGYYAQIFPCTASRGPEGGIHKAGYAHKKAIEKAIAKAIDQGQSP